jgi:prepilin peptidase CpaA
VNLASQFPYSVVLVAVLIAAASDIRAFKIYNALTLPLLASGLLYHGIVGGASALAASALGALLGLGLLFLVFLMGGMGGGDVKLMAGIGAWLGAPATIVVLAIASIAAGICALAMMVMYGRSRETWLNLKIVWHRISSVGRHLAAEDKVENVLERTEHRGRVIPFGAMVALGVVIVVVQTYLRTRS